MIKLLEHVGAQQRGELSFGKMGIQKAAWQSCYNALISKNISFDIQHSTTRTFISCHSEFGHVKVDVTEFRLWYAIVSWNCTYNKLYNELIHYAISQSMPVISHKSNWLHNISSYSIHNITTINSILCYCITNSLYNIM